MGLALRRIFLTVMAFAAPAMVPMPLAHGQELSEPSGQRDAIEVGRRRAEYREAINRFGEDNPRSLGPLVRLGYALLDASQYEEAERLFQRQRTVIEKSFPAEHIEASHPPHHLGETYRRMGRCAEAEPLLRRAIEMRERLAGAQHEWVARSLESLARCLSSLARFDEAETTFRRALDVMEKAQGPESTAVASVAVSFGEFYTGAARYSDAEPLFRRALEIRERVLGPKHGTVAATLAGLARVYRFTERYSQAEAAVKRSLAIREELFGLDHEYTSYSVSELGIVYMVMGRYAESIQMKRRALTTVERIFGPEHRQTGDALASLAETYYYQGRFAEAADLFQRATTTLEKAVGVSHSTLVFPLRMHGQTLRRLGRVDEAIPYLARALAVSEAVFGAENRRTAQTAAALARSLIELGRHGEAETLLRRSVAINQQHLGPDSAAVAFDTLNLARIKMRQEQYPAAEGLAREAVESIARLRGPDDFQAAWARTVLASAFENQNRFEPALVELRRATSAFQAQMDRSREERSGSNLAEQASYRDAFMDHVFLLWRAQNADAGRQRELTAEAFNVVQLAQATGTEAAVARMAARFASGTDKLAEIVRAREDAMERWRAKDASLVQLLGRPRSERDPQQEVRLRGEMREIDARLKDLDARIARDFPEYAELAAPRPAALQEIQSLLRPDEAVVLWLVGRRRTLIMAVRKDRTHFSRVDIGRAALDQAVRELRQGLDPSNVTSLQDIPRFDTTKAHALYRTVFAPIEPALGGARHVFMVPDAGLQSLPLGVLVTTAPEGPVTSMGGYRDVSWLAKRYATTVLPSVGALKSLRRFARTARASAPFIGIGDPTLDGLPGATRGVNLGRLYSRGAVADADEIRKLPPLPETADELTAMARTLGAGSDDLYLGARANERQVRRVDFKRYRVVAFATHGLMAGEFSDVGEPALVLTPPAQASAEDDGLLTASEIAGLQLDADWVILSACNTAAADGTPGAEGLSGLARAFFYAGSRTLLVSHWAVLSDAAVKLTTKMLSESAAAPTLPRSEAHRRAMLALATDVENPHYAHPMFWAPFVVVGEGGAPLPQ
jgi:CHAT domain-containing protein